jgi:acetyltransferase-like isoleucine patch superfamily enzyme
MKSVRRYLINHLTAFLPPTRPYGSKARLWRWAGIKTASNIRTVSSARFWTGRPVKNESDTFAGHGISIIGRDVSVTIGDRCDVGSYVLIVTGSHLDRGEFRTAGDGFSVSASIQDDIWIGANYSVLGGAEIGRGAVLAAGSLANKSVEPFTLVAGVPAREIHKREIHVIE